MISRPITIFLSVAEASGDAHAASLIKALARRLPNARFVGAAGPKMAAAGCEVVVDLTAEASMLGGPVGRLGYYYHAVRKLKRAIRRIKPDVHIPVDSPAMNWHLAAAAKKAGAKVVYYIAPQVWAWAPWRVRKLARLTDRVACILPFEQRYLRDRGVRATYVGNPIFDYLGPRPETLPDLGAAWTDGTWRVALLPGSRPAEITGHMPGVVETARAIRRRWPKSHCVVPAHDEAGAQAIHAATKGTDIEVVVGQTHDVLANSHFAVAKSGTTTLEAAHYGVPMVVYYRVGRLSYNLLGRWLVRMPYFSLVNILAGYHLVPELVPWFGDAAPLKNLVMEVMDDYGWLFSCREALLDLVEPLRPGSVPCASDNAAELVLQSLGE